MSKLKQKEVPKTIWTRLDPLPSPFWTMSKYEQIFPKDCFPKSNIFFGICVIVGLKLHIFFTYWKALFVYTSCSLNQPYGQLSLHVCPSVFVSPHSPSGASKKPITYLNISWISFKYHWGLISQLVSYPNYYNKLFSQYLFAQFINYSFGKILLNKLCHIFSLPIALTYVNTNLFFFK